MKKAMLFIVLLLVGFGFLYSYEPWVPSKVSQYPGGEALIQGEFNNPGSISGSPDVRTVSVQGQSFTEAVRISVKQLADKPWDVRWRMDINQSCRKGDLFLLSFWARAEAPRDESNEGYISVLIEDKNIYNKSLDKSINPGAEWTPYVFAVSMIESLDAHEYQVGLNFGARIQDVEIAGVELISFGKTVSLADLEALQTKSSYKGRAADAPWRDDAEKRIEEYRKADVAILVLDQGNPVSKASVSLEMIQHGYGFGTAVNAGLIASDNKRYKQEILRNFNKIVIENGMKWRYESEKNKRNVHKALDWATGNNLQARGHVLVWPGKRNLPENFKLFGARSINRKILSHIEDYVHEFRGEVSEWDVVNETYTNHDVMDITGIDIMTQWYSEARKADPSVKLFQNDYSILSGQDRKHRDFYFDQLHYLIDKGAEIDGIGMQGHFGASPTAIPEVYRRLERFSLLGKEIQITEFDVNTTDEELQADYVRDFMTIVFSHPSTTGILVWGFWEKAHWRPECAFFRADWSAKPVLESYRKLVFDEWWTDERGSTDRNGVWKSRGFKGMYKVIVVSEGVTHTFEFNLEDNANVSFDLQSGEVVFR